MMNISKGYSFVKADADSYMVVRDKDRKELFRVTKALYDEYDAGIFCNKLDSFEGNVIFDLKAGKPFRLVLAGDVKISGEKPDDTVRIKCARGNIGNVDLSIVGEEGIYTETLTLKEVKNSEIKISEKDNKIVGFEFCNNLLFDCKGEIISINEVRDYRTSEDFLILDGGKHLLLEKVDIYGNFGSSIRGDIVLLENVNISNGIYCDLNVNGELVIRNDDDEGVGNIYFGGRANDTSSCKFGNDFECLNSYNITLEGEVSVECPVRLEGGIDEPCSVVLQDSRIIGGERIETVGGDFRCADSVVNLGPIDLNIDSSVDIEKSTISFEVIDNVGVLKMENIEGEGLKLSNLDVIEISGDKNEISSIRNSSFFDSGSSIKVYLEGNSVIDGCFFGGLDCLHSKGSSGLFNCEIIDGDISIDDCRIHNSVLKNRVSVVNNSGGSTDIFDSSLNNSGLSGVGLCEKCDLESSFIKDVPFLSHRTFAGAEIENEDLSINGYDGAKDIKVTDKENVMNDIEL